VARGRYTLPHILGYHGCDAVIGERVLAGEADLEPSDNDYDWLGNGIYFWADSPDRAWDWANNRPGLKKFHEPFVLGALIYPGLCLNLTDIGVIEHLRIAYQFLAMSYGQQGMPKNTLMKDGVTLLRRRDCAVIETLHRIREQRNQDPYDSVMGVFEEGKPAFDGAGFREKTHIQLAVRDPEIIVSYFRVDEDTLRKATRRPHWPELSRGSDSAP
jgi:hypothetical protein